MQSELFRTPLAKGYWKSAAGELHRVQMLVLAAFFIALRVAVVSFRIPVAENLNIYFGFLVTSAGAMIYGPVLALLGGFVSDILSFFMAPNGPFFFGYTLSEMLGAFVYAVFLYRSQVTVARIAISKTIVNVLINIGLGSLWSAMLYSKGYYYYLAKSLVKNLLMLPIEILLMYLLFQALIPLAVRANIMPKQPVGHIPFLAKRRKRDANG